MCWKIINNKITVVSLSKKRSRDEGLTCKLRVSNGQLDLHVSPTSNERTKLVMDCDKKKEGNVVTASLKFFSKRSTNQQYCCNLFISKKGARTGNPGGLINHNPTYTRISRFSLEAAFSIAARSFARFAN